MVSPVLQQPRGFGGDAPVAWVGQTAPNVYFSAHAVDDGGVVFLLIVRDVVCQVQVGLLGCSLLLFGLGNGGQELGNPPGFNDLLRGLVASV